MYSKTQVRIARREGYTGACTPYPFFSRAGAHQGHNIGAEKKEKKKVKKRKKRKKGIKEKEAAINLAFISMDEFNFVLFYFKSLTPFLT